MTEFTELDFWPYSRRAGPKHAGALLRREYSDMYHSRRLMRSGARVARVVKHLINFTLAMKADQDDEAVY